MTAIDNPMNGYVDGHCDSEDLGMFLLSPGSIINIRNTAPTEEGSTILMLMKNEFDFYRTDFYEPSL